MSCSLLNTFRYTVARLFNDCSSSLLRQTCLQHWLGSFGMAKTIEFHLVLIIEFHLVLIMEAKCFQLNRPFPVAVRGSPLSCWTSQHGYRRITVRRWRVVVRHFKFTVTWSRAGITDVSWVGVECLRTLGVLEDRRLRRALGSDFMCSRVRSQVRRWHSALVSITVTYDGVISVSQLSSTGSLIGSPLFLTKRLRSKVPGESSHEGSAVRSWPCERNETTVYAEFHSSRGTRENGSHAKLPTEQIPTFLRNKSLIVLHTVWFTRSHWLLPSGW